MPRPAVEGPLVVLRAPRSRVWQALFDKGEFGTWFGVRFPAGTFAAGETVRGNITYPGYEHVVMEIEVVEVVAGQRFAYRWHPYAMDPAIDYAAEPMTLVEFTLRDEAGAAHRAERAAQPARGRLHGSGGDAHHRGPIQEPDHPEEGRNESEAARSRVAASRLPCRGRTTTDRPRPSPGAPLATPPTGSGSLSRWS